MDRTEPFIRTAYLIVSGSSPAVRALVEQMRMFGYINEQEYSEMNTIISRHSLGDAVRIDGAETIEMARGDKKDWISTWTTKDLEAHRRVGHSRGQVVCYDCANPQIVDPEEILPSLE